ncbi:hypothetical protein CYMTET_31987 [Cymbomonas tetramitiformis]|uniref:Uncharacterized protein n=1 Tax=Cymbomonas tetramitiformis TaxID=36881 RepID=A0AAE0KSL9_9CHLO|nr:hypothetical protein CYMTET_31987 [Cymbomonas tetramitiformis]
MESFADIDRTVTWRRCQDGSLLDAFSMQVENDTVPEVDDDLADAPLLIGDLEGTKIINLNQPFKRSRNACNRALCLPLVKENAVADVARAAEQYLETCVPTKAKGVLPLTKSLPIMTPYVGPRNKYGGLVLDPASPPPLDPVAREGLDTVVKALSPWRTCAVVGASGVLNRSAYGPKIDAHDLVWRINQSPAGGDFTEMVGQRTDVRILNDYWSSIYAMPGMIEHHELPLERNVTLLATRIKSQKPAAELHERITRLRREDVKVGRLNGVWEQSTMVAYGIYRKCLQRVHFRHFHGGRKVSLGLIAIFTAMHVCRDVTLYGFGHPGHSQPTFHGIGIPDTPALYYGGYGTSLMKDNGLTFHPSVSLGTEQDSSQGNAARISLYYERPGGAGGVTAAAAVMGVAPSSMARAGRLEVWGLRL